MSGTRPGGKRRNSLRNSVMLFYGLLLVCLVTSVSAVFYYRISAITRAEMDKNLSVLANQLNSGVQYRLGLLRTVLNGLCADSALQSALNADISDDYERYLAISAIRKKFDVGNLYADIYKIELIPQRNGLADGNFIIDRGNDGGWYDEMSRLSAAYIDVRYNSDRMMLELSKQVRAFSSNQLLGVIRVVVRADTIGDLLGEFGDVMNSVALLDARGGVIYQSGEKAGAMLTYLAGASLSETPLEIPSLGQTVISKTDQRSGVTLVIAVSSTDMMKDMRQAQVFVILIAGAITAVGFAVNFLLSKRIMRETERLVSKIQALGDGNFDSHIPEPSYENNDIGYLNRQFDIMVDKIKALISDIYEAGVKQRQIELRAIQAQLNPHFLYNTLSSINWMAIDIKADNISHAVNALAKYYRLTHSGGKEIISAGDEIEQVKAYIDIQMIRFSGKFEAVFDVDPEIGLYQAPKMILQPFVENSIIHGLELLDRKGRVVISADTGGDCLRFTVEDNGSGIDDDILRHITDPNVSGGYGIKNVVQKIRLLYGDQYGVSVESRKDEWTKVTIVLPKTVSGG